MTELMIESTCEVPGATSKLCGPVPKKHDGDYNCHRHNNAGAYKPHRIAGAATAREQHAQRRYQRKQGKEIQ